MKVPQYQHEEPLTPYGRVLVEPMTEIIVDTALFFKSPIDIPKFKSALKSSPLVEHPRFRSLLVRDRNGTEKWQETELDLDQHVIVIKNDKFSNISDGIMTAAKSEVVNAYLADLAVSNPLGLDKPLWEVHILVPYDCAVFRVHHAIGDGTSLMSMLSACLQKSNDSTTSSSNTNRSVRRPRNFLDTLKMVWFTIVYVLQLIGRALWIKDSKTVITGGAGVEFWTRKLATAVFSMDDMKMVKSAIPNATINDVLLGIISIGLSRYLDFRSPKASGANLTGMSLVNLREEPGLQDIANMMKTNSKSRWGNVFGFFLFPVNYHEAGSSPLQYIIRAKTMLDRKKQSLEAQFSYMIGNFLLTYFGAKVSSFYNYRVISNTTFMISNIVGPKEEMTFAGNLITSLRLNITCLPQAITMHMVSYAGQAELQILVAKDIIPDPEVLVKCFEDTLAEMKEEASGTAGTV